MMDKIKVVFILGTLELGGTEKQFLETVRRIDRKRFDLSVLAFHCQGPVRDAIEALSIPFQSLNFSGLKGKFRPQAYLQLYKLLRDIVQYLKQEQPQIVQSYLFWANIYGCLAAKIAGVPVIITGRRAMMEEQHKKFLTQWLQNLTNLWATAIIANSYAAQQECLQRDKFAPPPKIQVIYNGIEADRYVTSIDRATTKKALAVPESAQVVGIIASLHPRKAHQDFLNAAALVLRTCPNAVFLIVGRNDGVQPQLEALAEELSIRDKVIFTGERDDIPEMLSVLDVQVSSSVLEGLSNAILEGMAAGKPIVATQVAGNPELVVHEETGLLVPPGNPNALAAAIIRLLQDRVLRERLGKAGKQRVAMLFRMESMISQTETCYQTLVAEAQPARCHLEGPLFV